MAIFSLPFDEGSSVLEEVAEDFGQVWANVECGRGLHEALLVPVLLYGSDIMMGREKERSRTRALQMDNFRCLLGFRKY